MSPLPHGFGCPKCLYDLGGAASRICPECGREVVGQDLQTFEQVLVLQNRVWWRGLRDLVICTLGVGALGGCTAIGSIEWAWVVWIVGAVAILASFGGAALASRLAGAPKRAGYLGVWLRSHWWVHGPWLCLPVLGAVAMAAAVMDRGAGFAARGPRAVTPIVTLVTMVGFLAWIAWDVVCMVAWWMAWSRRARVLRLKDGGATAAIIAAAVLTYVASLALGVACGLALFIGAEEIANS